MEYVNNVTASGSSQNQIYAKNEDIKVYGKLVSMSTENVVADSEQIWDEKLKKNQQDINKDLYSAKDQYVKKSGDTMTGGLVAPSVAAGSIFANRIARNNGRPTWVLMGDGSVKVLAEKNGVASLDANGFVPINQLGNLDTTVAEVVAELPTTNIKKHIYMIQSDEHTDQNIYKEYIYTGDTSATYDASKWEQLGEYKPEVDLSIYAKKSGNSGDEISSRGPFISGGSMPGSFISDVSISESFIDLTKNDSYIINAHNCSTTAFSLSSSSSPIAAAIKINGFPTAFEVWGSKNLFDVSSYDVCIANDRLTARGFLSYNSLDRGYSKFFNTIGGFSDISSSAFAADQDKLGTIRLGYEDNGKNYKVQVDADGRAYVNVPWTDDQDLSDYAKKNEALGDITVREDPAQIGFDITYANNTAHITRVVNAATESLAGVMSATDKKKLNSLSNYTLSIATTTALGGIKLGTGLSATDDGTVSVSADVLEWDAIKNKPNVAILAGDDNYSNTDSAIMFDDSEESKMTLINGTLISLVNSAESGNIKALSLTSEGIHLVVGGDPVKDGIFMTDGSVFDASTIACTNTANVFGSSQTVQGSILIKNDADDAVLTLSTNGTIAAFGDDASSDKYFATDGSIQSITSISEDELNTILV